MRRAAQSLLLVAFGMVGLSFVAASWQLASAEPYFYAGIGTLIPGLCLLLLEAVGWQATA